MLASPNGVLPEYIKDGENGFLVSTYKDACAAVRKVAAMDEAETAEMAHRCRESAFRIETTAERYLELYRQVIRDSWLYPPALARSLRFRRPRSVVIKRWFS